MIKRYVGVASLMLLSSLIVISSEFERKEEFARDPQGNIMPSNVPGGAGVAQPEQALNQAEVEATAGSLLFDVKQTIASYLEEDKYVLWKKLNLPIGSLAFIDNGENLVSARREATSDVASVEISIISIKTGKMVNSFKIKGLRFVRKSFLLSPNGKTIAFVNSTDQDKIHFFDAETGKVAYSISNVLEGDARRFKIFEMFSQDGTILAMIYEDEFGENTSVRLFNVKTRSWIVLDGFDGKSRPYALSHDTFATVYRNGIRFWDISNGAVKTIEGLHAVIDEMKARGGNWTFDDICFGNDGKVLALTYVLKQPSGSIYGIRLFNYDSHKSSITNRASIEIKGRARLSLLSDTMVTVHDYSRNAETILFDNLTGNEIQRFGRDEDPGAFSPDDKIMAVATDNGIQLWKKSTALQDALKKQQLDIIASRKSALSQSSSSSTSASGPAGASSVLPPMSGNEQAVEPVELVDNAVIMHVSPPVGQGEKRSGIAIEQPD
ncbi:WD40 repeat domain-containing protein [Candidatus Dependentiae bacterium]|nr:WD40 repeat domain-containing protein [Candidatus Dependentiae bacterium]